MTSKSSADLIITYLNQTVIGLLVRFLEVALPKISDAWWEKNVIDKLTYTQTDRVKKSNISNLKNLDLAALLRIFDQNWYEISQQCNFKYEDRHFVKEMSSVRNRWAHISNLKYNADDTYRDLDTIQRFLKLINAEEYLIEELQGIKMDVLIAQKQEPIGRENLPEKINENQFQATQIVVVKSDRSKFGPVMSVQQGSPEDTVHVFIDGRTVPYFASQLEAKAEEETQELCCDEFHAYLSALEIRFPGMSNLLSLNTARVDFIPYQFRPVLRFIRADRPRMLIADSVGVGKTIEAGLILRELQARKEVRSILIICPRPLVTEKKWLNEMKRFDEDFAHLDGKLLRFCIDEAYKGDWPERYEKAIIPYSLFDKDFLEGHGRYPGLEQLDPPPHFDLVIVDEAHHIRNSDTYSHKIVKYFCDNAEAVLFLTATPIQLGTNDLYTLLNLLRPDLIIDPASFNHMAEPNPHINAAVSAMREKSGGWTGRAIKHLDDAAETSWGKELLVKNPEFINIKEQLKDEDVSQEKRVKLITATENLQTFSGIINRTRRRDIGDFTKRSSKTIESPFSPKQQKLHDTLLQMQAEILQSVHGEKSVAFMMCTIRRQAASCIFGLKPFLEIILKRHLEELVWDVGDDTGGEIDGSFISGIESQINSIIELANTLDDDDPKYNNLLQIIKEKQQLSNNKIMLYSSFRHTLFYLFKKLQDDGFRTGIIHGGIPDEERVELRMRFEKNRKENDAIDILLFSEVGCEGLDYQFCDCMVNYDLPWNPMRVEQRIGRIDRKGQNSPVIAIYNMITPGTIDADIFNRCLSRIGVFEKSIGDCEEILGEITRKIKSIADDFTLDEESRRKKLQQLTDNE
ncbi:MAG: DEAD/DEAH box helicase family protein, partial [Chitinispirillales bacterium]|nr:DEAD/DEAH box helicase family protein [Chitinispirillales bacterium]